jgi:hypothetical protein
MTSAVLGRKRLNALDSTALTNGGSSAGGPSTKSRKRTLVTNVEESTKYGSYEDDDEENGKSREAMEGDSMIIDDEEGNGERNGSKGMSDDEERSSKRMRSEEVVDEEGEVGEVTGEDYGHYGQPEEEEELEYAEEEEEMPPPPAKKGTSVSLPSRRMTLCIFEANVTTNEQLIIHSRRKLSPSRKKQFHRPLILSPPKSRKVTPLLRKISSEPRVSSIE